MTGSLDRRSFVPRGSRLWWGLPILLGLLWLAGATSGISYPGLPSPPDVTYWLLPATRFARDIAAAITVGALVVGALLVPGRSPRALGWALRWSSVWLGLVVLGLMLTRSEVEALSPLDALAPDSLVPLLLDQTVGRVFLGQFVALAVVIAITWALTAMLRQAEITIAGSRSITVLAWAAVLLAAGAAAAPAFVGHAGLHDSHVAATVSLLVHIAAVSLWVGGLVVVVALSRVEPRQAMAALPRFSIMALWCVILIAETGLLNASLRLTLPSEFVGSIYGSLILGKAALLGWLVALGHRQRRHVVNRADERDPEPLGSASGANTSVPALLARYAAGEFAIMGVAIALSIALARIGPAPAELATGGYTPVALAVLAIAVPMLLEWTRRSGPGWQASGGRLAGRQLTWLRSHSEVPAVVLLVVAADIAGLQALDGLLGVQLGTIVGVLVIVGVGWLWAACSNGRQGRAGIIVMMAGWPMVTWVNSLGQGFGSETGTRITIATLIGVEVLLAARLLASRIRRAESRSDADHAPASQGVAP